MSLNISLVMIKGDHRQNLSGILLPFRFASLLSVVEIADNDEVWRLARERCAPEVARKFVIFSNGWTVIVDPIAALAANSAACEAIAQNLAQSVLTLDSNGVVASYSFQYFEPHKKRAVWFDVDSGFIENVGEPLAEEHGLNIARKLDQTKLMQLSQRFGFDIATLNQSASYLLCELKYAKSAPDTAEVSANQTKRPWWKLWG